LRLAAPAPGISRSCSDWPPTRSTTSVGRLAAGIAHEINTPIQFVGDNAQVAHKPPKLPEAIPPLAITRRG
jgi:hypothetical protein